MQAPISSSIELYCSCCDQFDTAYLAPDRSVGCYSCGIHPASRGSSAGHELQDATAPEEAAPPAPSTRPARAPISSRPPSVRRRRRLDFAAINQAALARWPEVVARLLPAGRAWGDEWCVGSLRGEPGRSLKVRLRGQRVGAWCDFATGEKGGDPISLAAAVAGVSRVDAARQLGRMLGVEGADHG